MKHQDIEFKTKRIQEMETIAQNNSEIKKELNKTNTGNLPEYI